MKTQFGANIPSQQPTTLLTIRRTVKAVFMVIVLIVAVATFTLMAR